jgi:hypothetical protein
MYICDSWYVLYLLADQDVRTTHISCHMYTLLPPDDVLLASPNNVDVY